MADTSAAKLGRQSRRRGQRDLRHGPIPFSVVAGTPSMRLAVRTLGRKALALGFGLVAGHGERVRLDAIGVRKPDVDCLDPGCCFTQADATRRRGWRWKPASMSVSSRPEPMMGSP